MHKQIKEEITSLCEKGNEFVDNDNYINAVKVWEEALEKSLKHDLAEEIFWLYASIGDGYFQMQEYGKSKEYFFNAKSFVEGDGFRNPFVMLRLGQSYFELNQLPEATEYLTRAYMLEGEEMFAEEDEKYFEFLKTRIDIN